MAARMSAAGAAAPEPVLPCREKQAAYRDQQRQVLLAIAAGSALLAWLIVRQRRR
jgi:hypothetical protein